jgi:hypothetical protein
VEALCIARSSSVASCMQLVGRHDLGLLREGIDRPPKWGVTSLCSCIMHVKVCTTLVVPVFQVRCVCGGGICTCILGTCILGLHCLKQHRLRQRNWCCGDDPLANFLVR